MSLFVRESLLTFLRITEGTLDKKTGRYSEESEEEITLSGNLQPILGEDLVRAPEGARVSDLKTLYLHEELDEKDILLYKDKKYQVQKTDEWDPAFSPLPHYRYIAQLVGDVL